MTHGLKLRPTVVFAILFLFGGIFLFALFQRQVINYTTFAEAAERQSTSTLSQPAERGQILAQDKDGNSYVLAVSEWRYQLLLAPKQIKNAEKLVNLLKNDLPDLDTNTALEQIYSNKSYVPAIAKNIQSETARKIIAQHYTGVYVWPEIVRVYPEGSRLAAQVLGFVSQDGQLGKYGIESYYEQQLLGHSGSEVSKRDSFGRLIDVLNSTSALPGKDVTLTIDYNLQFTVEKKLQEAVSAYQADSGAIIVMNPKTGAILAVASQPTFDPNKYNEVKANEQRNFLLKAASEPYEPGSVMKPITMAMAIDLGLVQPETVKTFGKSVQVLDKEITNAEGKVYGTESMTQVLENSDNVAMVWVAEQVGSEKQRDYLSKLGLGEKTGLDLVGEEAGSLPPMKEWNDLKRANVAFGQGLSLTMVQLAEAYSALANGGLRVKPHLVAKVGDEVVETQGKEQVFSAETATKVREMLSSVVVNGHGKRAAVPGVRVGGKTGTAQVPKVSGGYEEDKFIGSFAGLFPVEDPKFVMIVRLDNPKTVKFAESSAAPTFGEIAKWMSNYYGLK